MCVFSFLRLKGLPGCEPGPGMVFNNTRAAPIDAVVFIAYTHTHGTACLLCKYIYTCVLNICPNFSTTYIICILSPLAKWREIYFVLTFYLSVLFDRYIHIIQKYIYILYDYYTQWRRRVARILLFRCCFVKESVVYYSGTVELYNGNQDALFRGVVLGFFVCLVLRMDIIMYL